MKKMKNVIVLLMFCFPILLSSQTRKTDVILEKKIGLGLIDLSYEAVINLQENDTSFYFSLMFQNQKYSYIRDYGSVFISNEDKFKSLFNDLVSAYKILMKGEKVNMSWTSSGYTLRISDNFKSKVFLYDDNKYTTINAEIIVSILKNMKNIDFGSYKLTSKD
jgi:hypothetical protein